MPLPRQLEKQDHVRNHCQFSLRLPTLFLSFCDFHTVYIKLPLQMHFHCANHDQQPQPLLNHDEYF